MSRPAPMCTILSFLGGPKALLVPQGFFLSTWHQASWEKASYTSREGNPYEPGSRHSLKRCGTFGLFASTTPSKESRPQLWCHLSCAAPMCTILSSSGRPKRTILCTWGRAVTSLLPKIHYYQNKRLQVKEISASNTNLQLNPNPNIQLDL